MRREKYLGRRNSNHEAGNSNGNAGVRPSDVSNIIEQSDVPLLTLNNEVQMPQLCLGRQIQRLKNDASEEGRYFNID